MNIQSPLYETYGGMAGLARIVLAHYDRVVAEPRLAGFFASVDMRQLIEHQTHFLASVMGGPSSFSDAELRVAHAHIAIGREDFDCMLDLLRESLVEGGLAGEHVELIIAEYDKRRAAIITR